MRGTPKVWYVVNPSDRERFERAVVSYVPSPKYLNDHERCARHVFALKSTIFDLMYLANLECHVIQPKRYLAIQSSPAGHGGFKSEQKVAKAVSFLDFS